MDEESNDTTDVEKFINEHINLNDLSMHESTSSIDALSCIGFGKDELDQQLKKLQKQVFGDNQFINNQKNYLKMKQDETYRLLQEKGNKEGQIQETESQMNAFHFDFGHLDAEVHTLMAQLESVYPNIYPMPDTTTTKSIYSTLKENLARLNLKVILNRLCLICKYKLSHKEAIDSDSDDWNDSKETQYLQDKFIEEFKKYRIRTESVFKKELGDITGCLLSYPDYFILMMEGPEISILDVLHQSKKLFNECINDGVVLFISGQVMVRFFQEWIDLKIRPPPNLSTDVPKVDDTEAHKEKLSLLSDQCQKLWISLATAQETGSNVSADFSELFPDEDILKFAIKSNLLRKFDSWYHSATTLSWSDYTSETWPQVFYSLPLTAHKVDTLFDFLGVIDKFDNLPGIDPQLDNFLNKKLSWKPGELNDL